MSSFSKKESFFFGGGGGRNEEFDVWSLTHLKMLVVATLSFKLSLDCRRELCVSLGKSHAQSPQTQSTNSQGSKTNKCPIERWGVPEQYSVNSFAFCLGCWIDTKTQGYETPCGATDSFGYVFARVGPNQVRGDTHFLRGAGL